MNWKIEKIWHDGVIYDIIDCKSDAIVCCIDHEVEIAKLIAAAPELLQQLELALVELEDAWSQITEFVSTEEINRQLLVAKNIEAAIANAKGEADEI